ncbi:Vgb family protein [Streptomyces abyssomicinicus]|uniref:Vgb family protein n=1 Tax=Streptomyces abyssomicinicus TaxID=574929 RepID=UPI00124FF69E|nr:YncE family protein [Streptomyces abyssomicinicus]
MSSRPSSRALSLRTVTAVALALAVTGALPAGGAAAAGTGAGTVPTTGVEAAPLVAGLYQSAYSERNDALWATAAVGMPPAPVTGSQLVKVDPDTLEVEAAYPVPVTESGTPEAVYGIDVDDEHNTLWVTSTRNDSVAVYSQRDGRHLATLTGAQHSREVVVDERRDLVWVSAYGSGELVAYDSGSFEEVRRVTVEGSGPTGLAVNERTGAVYAADYLNSRIIEVRPGAGSPRLLPAGSGPLGIALSPDGRTAYTADQTTGTLTVVSLRSGTVTATVPTGAGAKSVDVAPRTGRVVVVNRLAGDVSVVDPRTTEVVATVPTGPLPNHVRVTGGTAFVLDKSAAGATGEDRVTRVRLRAVTS